MTITTTTDDTGRALSHEDRSRQTAELLARAAAARNESDDSDTGDAERQALLDQVVVLNMRVAEAVARRFARRGVALDDLTSVAYVALVRAVRNFDPGMDKDLLSYAVPSIQGEIRRHFRDHGWTIRPPRDVQRAHSRIIRSVSTLDRVDERGVAELAAEVEESEELVREALNARHLFSLLSLDQPTISGGSEETLGHVIAADTERELEAADARVMLQPALAGLSERDRRIVHWRFVDELSQSAIGARLGISQMQVSRLLRRILDDLRGRLAEAC